MFASILQVKSWKLPSPYMILWPLFPCQIPTWPHLSPFPPTACALLTECLLWPCRLCAHPPLLEHSTPWTPTASSFPSLPLGLCSVPHLMRGLLPWPPCPLSLLSAPPQYDLFFCIILTISLYLFGNLFTLLLFPQVVVKLHEKSGFSVLFTVTSPGPRMGSSMEVEQYLLHERTDTIHRHTDTYMR